jgi:hypothetical protein
MKAIPAVVAVAMLPLALHAQDLAGLPLPLAEKVEAARQACMGFERGEFTLEWGAVTRVDLDGDMRGDWVLDESSFACSSAVSLYCGTGGCNSHFLVGDELTTFLNQGWAMVTFGRHRILLLDLHGSDCGGINPTPCVDARAWDAESSTWRSVKPPVE